MREEINGILAIWYREWRVYLREWSRIVASIVNPILWLVVFGGGLGSSVRLAGVNYQTFIYPGILAQAVIFSSIFFGFYIVWDRKIDFLKEVMVAPISRASMFVGKVAGGVTDSMVQSLMLLLIGAVLGSVGFIPGLHLTVTSFLGALLILFLTSVSLVSIGLIVGSIMESPEGFQLISSFLLFPIFFLSGALFPLTGLPNWIAPLTRLNPVTYSVDALRHVILGHSEFPLLLDIGVMVTFGVIVIVVGTYAFDKMKV